MKLPKICEHCGKEHLTQGELDVKVKGTGIADEVLPRAEAAPSPLSTLPVKIKTKKAV